MNFAALPPEVNSGLMYTGPGSGPTLAAAAAWDGLAGELHSAATAYQSVLSDLTNGPWLGPASAAMATAAAPYLEWLATTAAQAEETAARARAAAAAYETAFAMTVPPPVIAANRVQLATLIATNIFGQNTPAIAATEAQYGEMWAQDAATMYGYAGSATNAATLTPFTPAARTANPAAAVNQAAGGAQGTGQAVSSQLISAAALAAPAQEIIPAELASVIPTVSLAVATSAASVNPSIAGSAWNAAAMNNRLLLANGDAILNNTHGILVQQDQLSEIVLDLRALMNGSAPLSAGLRAAPAPVSAAMGAALSAGKLSVPLSWAAAAPQIRTAAYGLSAISPVAPAALAGTPATAFSQMALAGMGGSALAGTVGRGRREQVGSTVGDRPKSIAGEHVLEPQQAAESPVAEIAAGLRDLADLRDSGLLTRDEFSAQKQRLLAGPLR